MNNQPLSSSGHESYSMVKIISGGQTGVDRAALDAALSLGIECGGWCPKGRRAEDGTIPETYPLQESTAKAYPVRTKQNVRDSDGTLILTNGNPDRGTALTLRLAQEYGKPYWVVDLDEPVDPDLLKSKIAADSVEVLNVAGPRESSCRGIYERAKSYLVTLFGKLEKA